MSSTRSLVELSVGVLSFTLALNVVAQENRPLGAGGATKAGASAVTQKSAPKSSRGVLPDPAIFDGSALAPEKKAEHGMLGEFELPGDENATSGKVGGQQPPPQGRGGGGPPPPPPIVSIPLPGLPGMSGAGGLPSQGSGSSILSDPTKMGSGGAGQADPTALPNPNSGGDGAAPAGGETSSTVGSDVQGGAPGSVQGGAPATGVTKPKPVVIGDPSRQIKTSAPIPGVVGASTATGPVIPTDKSGLPSGGKGSPGENANRGVEKGRAMPAGL